MSRHVDVATMLFGGQPKVLDHLTIPTRHVFRVIELAQAIADAESPEADQAYGGILSAQLRMWEFVEDVLPACKGMKYRICTDDPLHPVVMVTGKCPTFKVGSKFQGRRIIKLFTFDDNQLMTFLKLNDDMRRGPLFKYKLFQFIANITGDDRGISETQLPYVAPEFKGIIKLDEKDEDADE